jgi:hypothetical protein
MGPLVVCVWGKTNNTSIFVTYGILAVLPMDFLKFGVRRAVPYLHKMKKALIPEKPAKPEFKGPPRPSVAAIRLAPSEERRRTQEKSRTSESTKRPSHASESQEEQSRVSESQEAQSRVSESREVQSHASDSQEAQSHGGESREAQ